MAGGLGWNRTVIAGIIAGASAFIAFLGFITWIIRRGDAAIERATDSRVAQVDTEGHLTSANYEHELTKRALTAEKRRGDVLEALLAAEQETDADADLDPRDVRGRVLREAIQWRPPAGDSIRPEPTDDLPPGEGPGSGSGAPDLRSPTGPDV